MAVNFADEMSRTWQDSLTCRKILRHGPGGFTSHPKEVVLRTFIALKSEVLGPV
jgi:hypothetical protein